SVLLFFFFQAEDGIRDGHVTGVQTCALPIYLDERPEQPRADADGEGGQGHGGEPREQHPGLRAQPAAGRPERGEAQYAPRPETEIGRASCRERCESSAGPSALIEITVQRMLQ